MKECFECGSIEDLNEHHPVPRSRGGTKTITLCYSCHCNAHGRDGMGLNHGRLVSEGIRRKNGGNMSKWGAGHPDRREKSVADLTKGRIQTADNFALGEAGIFSTLCSEMGMSLNEIIRALEAAGYKTRRGNSNWRKTTVSRLIKRHKKLKLEDR